MFLGQSADGEGFELPDDIQGNHADPEARETNTTRAQNGVGSAATLPDEIIQLIDTCTQMSKQALERVLNFAKFELANKE